MKIFASILALILSLSFVSSTHAQATPTPPPNPVDQCTDIIKAFGAWRFHRYETSDEPRDCFMSALSVDVPGLLYRSYLFTMGELMVFNSYNADVDDSTAGTGARVFFFFPRNQTPDIEDIGDVVYMKTSTAGISLGFNFKTNQVVGFQGVEATIDPKVTPDNNGGVEIKKSPTLWLDLGFAQGHDPSQETNRTVAFHDIKGNTCNVKNSEIFTYEANENNYFKFSDAELKTFLQKRCPSLYINY